MCLLADFFFTSFSSGLIFLPSFSFSFPLALSLLHAEPPGTESNFLFALQIASLCFLLACFVLSRGTLSLYFSLLFYVLYRFCIVETHVCLTLFCVGMYSGFMYMYVYLMYRFIFSLTDICTYIECIYTYAQKNICVNVSIHLQYIYIYMFFALFFVCLLVNVYKVSQYSLICTSKQTLHQGNRSYSRNANL